MSLGQFVVLVIAVAVIVYEVHYIIVDLEFPFCIIKALKRYRCPICGKRLWTAWSKCCQDTPEYKAYREQVEKKYQLSQEKQRYEREYYSSIVPFEERKKPGSTQYGRHHSRERDCPRCNGKPGNYMCPMCEGRGKTFM